jgi:hypothetical protein
MDPSRKNKPATRAASRKYEKRRRAPEPGTPIQTRLQAGLLAELDRWRARHNPDMSRPEAIRQILVQALRQRA